MKGENVNVTAFTITYIPAARMARAQSQFEHSPVTINLIQACASILTPMSNTIIDIYTAGLTGPTRRADAGVAAGVVQHAAASVGTGLLTNRKKPLDE